MTDVAADLLNFGGQDLATRKTWYSPAAIAYTQARPAYPAALIDRVITLANLQQAKILEVGCGPGTATVDFAPLVGSIDALEPNPDFYALAQQNGAALTNLRLHHTAFEEWPLDQTYDALLAASSFHWIPADIGYPKAAQLLAPGGHLILLWNKELQPSWEIHQQLAAAYQHHAPGLNRYEDEETQQDILRQLGQMAIDSGHFHNLVAGEVRSNYVYGVDRYLTLLQTYSPYLKLAPENRQALFQDLRQIIEKDLGGQIQLSNTCAFHITQKIDEET
jgi:SAM-dependent methyltransferase